MSFRIAGIIAVTLSLPASAAVGGRVVAPDGTPLPSIEVVAVHPQPSGMAMLTATVAEPLAIAKTAADGTFSLDVNRHGVVELRVRADGYVPFDLLVPTDEPAGVLRLEKASLVSGRVTAGGKPVAGAKVLVSSESTSVRVETDAAGVYRVADPARWANWIVVVHPQFAPAMHTATVPDFALTRGRTLKGRVIDDQRKGVAGASVGLGGVLSTTTDEDGDFTLDHVPAEMAALRVVAPGRVAVKPLVSGVPTITLTPSAIIKGVVRDTKGRPLAGMRVTVSGEDGSSETVTDVRGAYALSDLPRGELYVIASGGRAWEIDLVEADGSSGDVTVDLTAKRLAPIDGIVVRSEKRAVEGATIVVRLRAMNGAEGTQPTGVVSDEEGRFRLYLSPIDNVTATVLAVKAGFPPAESAPLQDGAREVTISMSEGESVRGMVTGPDGAPLAAVRVDPAFEVIRSSGFPTRELTDDDAWAVTGADGRFEARLARGTTALRFVKKGYLPAEHLAEVSSSAQKPIEVSLARSVAISGKVVDASGSGVADVRIMTAEAMAVSAPDGTFTIEGLAAGPVQLRFGRSSAQEQVMTAPAKGIKLVVPVMQTIRGRVVDAKTGRPIPAFTVLWESGEGSTSESFESSEGTFELEVEKGGTLGASADGYVTRTGIAQNEESAPLVVSLVEGRRVRGRVTDEQRQPVAGVTVSQENSYRTERREPPMTDAGGTYEIVGLPFDAGTDLTFQKEGFVSSVQRVARGDGDATLNVALSRGVIVTGKVLGAGGAGVPGAQVTATSAGHGAQYASAQTDSSGAFRFEALARTRYDFEVSRTEEGLTASVHDVDVEKVRDVQLRLEAKASATISGRIEGLGAGRGTVHASNAAGDAQSGPLDVQGNFRIANAPVGLVEVRGYVFRPEGARVTERVLTEVAPGSEVRVELQFAQQVTVRGRVTRSSIPLPGAALTFAGTNSAQALTTEDGSYTVEIEPGAYVAWASLGGRRLPAGRTVVVTGDAQVDLSFDSATIAAQIVDARTGAALSGVTVSVSKRGETHDIASAKTNGEGVAVLETIPNEPLTLIAAKAGFASAS